MSELKEIIDKIEMLWQANSLDAQIKSIKDSNPVWYECSLDKTLVFSLMGHQRFFTEELIKLKIAVERLEQNSNK